MIEDAPCKGCNERVLYCHSNCEKYKLLKKENNAREIENARRVLLINISIPRNNVQKAITTIKNER